RGCRARALRGSAFLQASARPLPAHDKRGNGGSVSVSERIGLASRTAVERREVHQGEVGAKRLVSTNAFVVVQEIAATEKDDPIAVDLDSLWMVRRIALCNSQRC